MIKSIPTNSSSNSSNSSNSSSSSSISNIDKCNIDNDMQTFLNKQEQEDGDGNGNGNGDGMTVSPTKLEYDQQQQQQQQQQGSTGCQTSTPPTTTTINIGTTTADEMAQVELLISHHHHVRSHSNGNSNNSNNNHGGSTSSSSSSVQNIKLSQTPVLSSASTLSPQHSSLLSVMDGAVDQTETLKEELKKRSIIANQLRKERMRVSISTACREIIEYMEIIDDPFVNDYHNNPFKKASKVTVDKHAKHNVDGVLALRNYNEMIALGMSNCKLDLVLRGIKTHSGVNDIDRHWYNNYMVDCAVSVLRLLAKQVVDQMIIKQNQQHVPPHLQSQQLPHPTPPLQLQSGVLSESRRNEIIAKLSKIKDDAYTVRPLPQQSLLDLRLFWNDPSVQSIYSNPSFKHSLPIYLQHAIENYSILERVFIGNLQNNNNNHNSNNNNSSNNLNNSNNNMEIKRFEDSDILDQIIYSRNTIPEYYVMNEIRITDISSMLTSHPSSLTEKWIKDFSDAKAFIWCCSLASFNTTSSDFPPFLNPVEITNPSSVLNRKKLLTLKPALSNISLNSDVTSPILSPIISPRKELMSSPSLNSPPVNSLIKSIQLFKLLSSQSNVPAIIVLTEREGFNEKIKNAIDFKTLFPDYKGTNKDNHAMIEFIKQQFNPPNAAKSVTFHISNFDGKEDIKIISNVLFTIQTQDVVDVFI
ncbi:G-protein alpha subunit family protein [Cavenderia fasciculata]|uniref:G-protein alpha subunit family protein n=1 Tax=Cavenderia fasciculata TaxID=261658 RepID=F4PH92_CACFS|nr:G-protein alpha subunit family protein [Cavenderia fasciculata]EGG25076.1 G-protein alpha subunit family protein [Cavenderia fasciculata]|eukprot:XP_004362927.1 G-protein alpha subunit family protein [Cavenderia fasciculata]